MKQQLSILLVFFTICLTAMAQGGQWAWVKGSNTPNAMAVYGVKGISATGNTPQGLCGAAYWPDMQGNFWVFGGFDGNLDVPCAMWRYSPANNEWAWMSGKDSIQEQGIAGPGAPNYGTRGAAASTNFPGARIWTTQWTDNNGILWLFGGSGWDSTGYPGTYNDLWKYDISTNLWTWVSGSNQMNAVDVYGTLQQPSDTAMPGARYSAGASWVDANNNLWFFGGVENNTSFNDMWRYNITTNQWTWMNGPQGWGNAGNYGTQNVESASNVPSHRVAYSRWKDACGNFYLWGGGDFWIGEPSNANRYSDVWKYDVTTNYWVWVAGENTGGSPGHYNQYCTDNGVTGPRARTFNSTPQVLEATDVFIGYAGYCSDSGNVGLDDIWLFNSATNEWKWIGGQQGVGATGAYGPIGALSASYLPPSRYEQCMWVDSSGAVWMFGGEGNTPYNMFNDVWKFVPDTSCTGIPLVNGSEAKYQLSSNTICNGGHVSLALNGIANASIYPSGSVTWQDTANALLSPDSTTTYTLSGKTSCTINDTISFTILVSPITAQVAANPLVFCSGDSTNICTTSGFASYYWNTGDTTMCIETKNAGNYYVTVTNAGGCTATSNRVDVSNYIPSPVTISVNGDTLTSYNAISYQWEFNGQPIPGDTTNTLIATQPGNYAVEITDTNGCQYSSSVTKITTAIGNITTANAVKLYPNPNTGNFTLAFTDNVVREVEIIDAIGHTVVPLVKVAGQKQFNLNELSAGDYFLRITCNKQVRTLNFNIVK